MIAPDILRIGNWVGYKVNHSNYTATEIAALSKEECTLFWDPEGGYSTASYQQLRGLPIDDKYLAMFGFKQRGEEWWKKIKIQEETYSLELRSYQGWYFEHISLPNQPQFIHELQNLYFILSGQELQVENLKK